MKNEIKAKTIIVNDVAASSGGALSILKQFLDEISTNNLAKKFRWIIFVSNDKVNEYNSNHIDIVKVNMKSWPKRIWWDTFGIKKWLKAHGIKPAVAISLMSVGLKYLDVPQIVYIHQSLPFGDFHEFKWFEWKARFYTWGIFEWMKWSIKKDSTIVVQTYWMKKAVYCKLGTPLEHIYTIKPNVKMPEQSNSYTIANSKELSYELFYPAVPMISYKNHELLIRVVSELKKDNKELGKKIRLIFTCKPKMNQLTKYYHKLATTLNVNDNINWVGYLSKKQMFENYMRCDAVLFPSQLETFGLPLIEAASLGKRIFVLDKPYAHDVLQNYNGAVFIPNDAKVWANKITDFYSKNRKLIKPLDRTKINEWNKFIDLVVNLNKGFANV